MKFKQLISIFLLSALLSSCSATEKQAEKTMYAMDTVMSLKAYGENADKAVLAAEEKINYLDRLLRRKSEDSDIFAVNTNGSAAVADDTAELVKRSLEICHLTGGSFDISVAPVMDLWGFYDKNFYVPSPDELSDALKSVGYENITANGNDISAKNNAQIDLGGIAKGFASSKTADIFKEFGVSGIISLGGNVQAVGTKPDGSLWCVAIQAPEEENSYLGTVSVSDTAVITSGAYQRYFERDGKIYHHIIDPKTGYPADSDLTSVTIVSPDGTEADGLSTALFVMGLDNACEFWREHEGFEAVLADKDNRLYITEGLSDIFESDRPYTVIKRAEN